MKRLIAATIGLALLAATPAMADGWHGRDRYDGYRNHDNTGAIVAVGVGLAALAIIASQHHHHDDDGYYGRVRYDDGYGPRYERRYEERRTYDGRGYYEDQRVYYRGDDDDE